MPPRDMRFHQDLRVYWGCTHASQRRFFCQIRTIEPDVASSEQASDDGSNR
jgi:hypothetical protein